VTDFIFIRVSYIDTLERYADEIVNE